jgi:hypothetical protein
LAVDVRDFSAILRPIPLYLRYAYALPTNGGGSEEMAAQEAQQGEGGNKSCFNGASVQWFV